MKTIVHQLMKTGSAFRSFREVEIALPLPKAQEVCIEVEAFGLNYADVMARKGMYRETPSLPCVLGYEVVGRVIEVGNQENAHLLQKRVVAFTRFGGYAHHAITFADAVAEIDAKLDVNTALSMVVQGVTAYYLSCYLAPIHKNDRVLIHAAAGGVGSLLIQLAKNAGAEIFAKVSSEDKKQRCIELGADHTINYKTNNYVQEILKITNGQPINVSYNPVGGSTFKEDRKLLGVGSRLFLFGGSQLGEGKLGFLSQLNFLRKMGFITPIFMSIQSKSLIGVNVLKIADTQPKLLNHCLHEIIKIHQRNEIQTQNGGVFPSSDLAYAHDLLESGKSMGKIVVLTK